MKQKITTPYSKEKTVFFAMVFVVFLLFVTYVYFVSASIAHVIVRKEIDRDITGVSSYLSDLEAEFIVAKQAIDEETIRQHGFALDATSKVYITRRPSSLVLVTGDESL